MKVILFILLFVGIGYSQSANPADYSPVFFHNRVTHYVDRGSVEFLAGKKVVFWALFPYKDVVTVNSMEVDCQARKARVRAILFTNGVQVVGGRSISYWFPRTDALANKYIRFACSLY